jgi:hypothetical protein
MNPKKSKQIISISIALLSLILGSFIYILFRPKTLMMFHWADTLGLMNSIESMRYSIIGFKKNVPKWFIFSLPFSLWVLAYLLFIDAIWVNTQSWSRNIWFLIIPIIAILSEFAQSIYVIPGKYDWGDLATIIIAIIFGAFITSILNFKKGEKIHD